MSSHSPPTSFCERFNKVMTKGIDVISSTDSDSDYDRACKPRVLLAEQFRSNSAHTFRRRAEKVWATPEKEDEPEKPKPESKFVSEEKVGDIIHLDRTDYFIVNIFEKEITELGDRVDLNYTRFKKFEVVYGDAPRDHRFYNNRCCYSSYCCVCAGGTVEKEWGVLERELTSREKQGVSFFARTYKERKELMRVVATVTKGDCISHSLFFFDVKFPTEYPNQAPSFSYHSYGLPLSNPEILKPLRQKFCYNILDVFRDIQELVLMNTNKSSHQMLDMLQRPLTGFEDFVPGHFRKKGALILRNMMEEMDMEKERDRNMFWKMYIAFEDNKSYCDHLLNSDMKEELKKFKEKEYSLSDDHYSSSTYFPSVMSRFDDVKRTSKSQILWNKLPFLF